MQPRGKKFIGVNPIALLLAQSPRLFDTLRRFYVQNRLFLSGVSGAGDPTFERSYLLNQGR